LVLADMAPTSGRGFFFAVVAGLCHCSCPADKQLLRQDKIWRNGAKLVCWLKMKRLYCVFCLLKKVEVMGSAD